MLLKPRLERWRNAGLIDDAQVRSITAFEAEDRTAARWLIWSIAAVGGLAIVAGIISVIAANWDEIPDPVKLSVAVIALAGVAFGAMRLDGLADGWPTDLLLLVHQLLVLGVIGLVAQVFHLSGTPWGPFAVATVFAVPVAIAGRRALLVQVAIAFAFLTLGIYLDTIDVLEKLFEDSMQILPLAASIGAVFYCGHYLLRAHEKYAIALRQTGLTLLIVSACAESLRWNLVDPEPGPHQMIGMVALSVAVVAVLVTFQPVSPIRLIGLVSAIVLFLGPELVAAERTLFVKVAGFVLSVAVCLAWAFIAADLGRRGQVNLATSLMAIRIVIAFADLFNTLMGTGLGLLSTGFVLIAVAIAWWKLRGAIPVAEAAS